MQYVVPKGNKPSHLIYFIDSLFILFFNELYIGLTTIPVDGITVPTLAYGLDGLLNRKTTFVLTISLLSESRRLAPFSIQNVKTCYGRRRAIVCNLYCSHAIG